MVDPVGLTLSLSNLWFSDGMLAIQAHCTVAEVASRGEESAALSSGGRALGSIFCPFVKLRGGLTATGAIPREFVGFRRPSY